MDIRGLPLLSGPPSLPDESVSETHCRKCAKAVGVFTPRSKRCNHCGMFRLRLVYQINNFVIDTRLLVLSIMCGLSGAYASTWRRARPPSYVGLCVLHRI